MEDLKKEITTLKNGIEALAVVMASYQNAVDILTLKLEEYNDHKIDISESVIAERINSFMDTHLPYCVEMNFSDGGFNATLELNLMETLKEELPYKWESDLAKAIINDIQDTNK
jgi:hypothetical protein